MNLRSINGHPLSENRLSADNKRDFDGFYDRYAPAVFRFILGLLACEKQTEMVFHTAMREIWINREQISNTKTGFLPSAIRFIGKSMYTIQRQIAVTAVNENSTDTMPDATLSDLAKGYKNLLTLRRLLGTEDLTWQLNASYHSSSKTGTNRDTDESVSRRQWAKRMMEQIRYNKFHGVSGSQTA